MSDTCKNRYKQRVSRVNLDAHEVKGDLVVLELNSCGQPVYRRTVKIRVCHQRPCDHVKERIYKYKCKTEHKEIHEDPEQYLFNTGGTGVFP